MPSSSRAQAYFFKKACEDPEFAKKHGLTTETACEWYHKDLEEGKWFPKETKKTKPPKKPKVEKKIKLPRSAEW